MKSLFTVLSLAVLVFSLGWADDKEKPVLSRTPYLQLPTHDSIRIVWRTSKPITPVLRYGSPAGTLDHKVSSKLIITRRPLRFQFTGPLPEGAEVPSPPLHSAPDDTWQFEATINGLRPDTSYAYAVYDGEDRLTKNDGTYVFKTHPVIGTAAPARFWVVGDSGTGEKRPKEVHEAMLNHIKKDARQLDFYLHVGDMAYTDGTDAEFQKNFFAIYDTTLRRVPVWPALGNHEGHTAQGDLGLGPYFDAYVSPTNGEAGGVPSGTEAYYSWDYGHIHFIALDSFDLDRSPDAAMAQWLREDLNKTKADWLIAFWHHPPYTKGSHDSDIETELVEMRENIMPILEDHGVDVVFTGHSHIYERSMLMDGAYSTPTTAENVILDDGDGDPSGDGPYRKTPGLEPHRGTVQVVAGHGGTGVGRKGTMPVMKKIFVENGSVIVDVNDHTLEAIMIKHDGKIRDRFQLVKRPGIPVVRVTNPRVPPPFVKPGKKMPGDKVLLTKEHGTWKYLADADPAENWMGDDFDASSWKSGPAGFGAKPKDGTSIPKNTKRVYLRNTFHVEEEDLELVGLAIDYDDAFVAYVNGTEFARQGIEAGAGKTAEGIGDHQPGEVEFFAIAKERLKTGVNTIAIEGHNILSDDENYILAPYLVRKLRRSEKTRLPAPVLSRTVGKDDWKYLAGSDPKDEAWKTDGFDDKRWKSLETYLGYGLGRNTKDTLPKMKGKYERVHLRRTFKKDDIPDLITTGLTLSWDDGFEAWLNGKKMVSDNVKEKDGKLDVSKRASSASAFFPFEPHKDLLKKNNVIAITVHNQDVDSSDFFANPFITEAWPKNGEAVPAKAAEIIKKDAKWKYMAGRDPGAKWVEKNFDDSEWFDARMPIGYGRPIRKLLGTSLDDMRENYTRVYLRKTFKLTKPEDAEGLGLSISWSHGFIAYVNGVEVVRMGVRSGSGASAADIFSKRMARPRKALERQFFPLADQIDSFQAGDNTISIEAHLSDANRRMFFVAPAIIRKSPEGDPTKMPDFFTAHIPHKANWHYIPGGPPPSTQWNQLDYRADGQWKTGPAGFGYADRDDVTTIGMWRKFKTLYIRREFNITDPELVKDLALAIRWDDGFIAYLNGKEITRQNIAIGAGTKADGMTKTEAREDYLAFPLKPYLKELRAGRNVLAIEGHNHAIDSSDFTLDPFLIEPTDTKMPKEYIGLIKEGAIWSYLAGSDPEGNWTEYSYDDSQWKKGKAGIGYGDDDDNTRLKDMEDNYERVYMRHRFTIDDLRPIKRLGLAVSYDDAFIAYLNGKEIVRVGVGKNSGAEAEKIESHEAEKKFYNFPIDLNLLKHGRNILAVEGHNDEVDSSDFTLHPTLIRVLSP